MFKENFHVIESYEIKEYATEDYDILDGCYHEILSTCLKGTFLSLDNREDAFTYKFGNLELSTLMLCTEKQLSNDANRC